MTFRFFQNHHVDIALFFCVMCIVVIVQYSGLDLFIARLIYQSTDNQFLTDNPLLSDVFHKGGRYLVACIVGVFMLGLTLTLFPSTLLSHLRPFFGYMILSIVSCLLVIAILKQFTTLPCPWDTQYFGGTRSYLGLFSAFDPNLSNGHCYPSGHASGGFSLFGFYFWRARRQQVIQSVTKKVVWLLPAILIGTTFALTQELRGAHYFSHDLTTIGICWIICSLTLRPFLAPYSAKC